MAPEFNALEQLQEEHAALRRELDEALQTLEAIRRGQTDAILVDGRDGPQVYMLTGADRPYRIMVEQMQEGAAALREDGLITYCNEQLAVMLGTTHQNLLGKHLQAFLTPASQPLFAALLRDSVRAPSHGEVILAAREGTRVPALVALHTLADETPTLVSAVVADLTEQKRHHEILAAEEFSSLVLDQATDAVVVCNPTGRIIRANQAAHRLCGTNLLLQPFDTAFPLRLAPATELEPPDAVSCHVPLALFESGRMVEPVRGMEVELPCGPDGRWHLLLSSGPLLNADSEPLGYIITLTDITERKRAEKRTQLLSDVAAHLLASDQPQQVIDQLCRRVMEHLECDGFVCYLAQAQTSRLHLHAHCGVPTEVLPDVMCLEYDTAITGRVARDGVPIVAERIQTTCDPRADVLRACGVQAYACYPLINQGETIGTLAFGARGKDVFNHDELSVVKVVADHVAIAVQRMRLVESLEHHAQAAQIANEAKSQFLANISHELRTPMNAILGMIDLALPRTVDDMAQDCLGTARESADLLLSLLNDLLDSAKIESGKLELDVAPFSLRHMLGHIARILAVRAGEKGLRFYSNVPADIPDDVLGDRNRLQQVLLNLAGNAIKFTEQGEVEIRVRTMTRDTATRDTAAYLEFAVRDTGIGIPAATVERLFQPFVQADASTARRFGGTGLGLSICRDLVQLMGGQIRVESELGEGSTFSFALRLPLVADMASHTTPAAVPPADPCRPLRILLAEDNPANQKLGMYILRDRGHTVELAGDGHQAVHMAGRCRYDVIVMDVQMPGMNGLDAMATIRQQEGGGPRVPIIAMTAHTMRGDRDRCLAAGADGYLSKPVNASELISLVERLASGMEHLASSRPPAPAAVGTAEPVVFDPEEALSRCFHNVDMVREMVQCYFTDLDTLCPQLRAAAERGDYPEVSRLAHRLNGTLAYLGAQPARDAAQRLEQLCGRGPTPAAARDAVSLFEQECLTLRAALAEHAGAPQWADGG